MQISLILDPARLWRWHLALIEQLSADPATRVHVVRAPQPRPLEGALRLALRLDAATGSRARNPLDALGPQDLNFGPALGSSDLIIDLAAITLPAIVPPVRTLIPLYDGVPGEPQFWTKVLAGKSPLLAIFDGAGAGIPVGLAGLESPHALRSSASAVITRLITGLTRAARTKPAINALNAQPVQATHAPSLARSATRLLLRKTASKGGRILNRTLKTTRQWAVAWRTLPPGTPIPARGTTTLDLADWTLLPDDGQRYYADPFLVANGDAVDVFVEELPYATNRGIISMFPILPDGRITAPRPVLATAHHMSYPQVFERDGATWMLPEQSASGGLILYRARRYPDEWQQAARLIDEPVHDATLFEHGGRLWIAATTQGPLGARWGSSWDGLSLYSAKTLLGPWTPHPGNPVLIDARSARPAGAMFSQNGALYRPVQDCSRAYGGALGIAEITGLNTDAFTQTLTGRLEFGPRSHLLGPHTLNRIATPAGIVEIIDLFAAPAVLRSAARA